MRTESLLCMLILFHKNKLEMINMELPPNWLARSTAMVRSLWRVAQGRVSKAAAGDGLGRCRGGTGGTGDGKADAALLQSRPR